MTTNQPTNEKNVSLRHTLATLAYRAAKALRNAPPGFLEFRPADGSRSAGEILAHLADCEIVTGWRIRQILGAPGTPIQPFDQDAWAASGHYEKRDARKSLEQFRVAREGNLALLKSLTPEQWNHHGMHAERGVETIERIVSMMAGHDINHTAQVERIVAAKKGKR